VTRRNQNGYRRFASQPKRRAQLKRKSLSFERLEERLVFSVDLSTLPTVSFSNATPEGAALTLADEVHWAQLMAGSQSTASGDGLTSLAGQVGRTFDLFDWTGVTPTGAFAVSSPYTWNLANLYTTGEVTLTAIPGLPGDFNQDGSVDAADYVVWRKGAYTQADYLVWRAHFGQTAFSGAALPAAGATSSPVPEPATLVLLMFAATGWCLLRRRAA
jgi:PEP-CTERM motif